MHARMAYLASLGLLVLMLQISHGVQAEELWQSWPKRQVISPTGLKLYSKPYEGAATKGSLPKCAVFYYDDSTEHIPSKRSDNFCWIQIYYQGKYGWIHSSSGTKRCPGGSRVALVAYNPATACKKQPTVNPCKGNPCGRSGTCYPTKDGKSYTCKCKPDFWQCPDRNTGKLVGQCNCGTCRRIALGCDGWDHDQCKKGTANCVSGSPKFSCCCCKDIFGP